MPRPPARDVATIAALRRELGVLRLDSNEPDGGWLPELCQALGFERALIYAARRDSAGHSLAWCVTKGMSEGSARFRNELAALVRRSPDRWGLFDPGQPEPAQRNRALEVPPLERVREQLEDAELAQERYGLRGEALASAREALDRAAELPVATLRGQWALRMLVCDSARVLGWVGGFRSQPFSPREVRLLQSLLPDLLRRLAVRRTLSSGPLHEAALRAALEEVNRAAYVTDPEGVVVATNTLGQSALDRSPTEVRASLAHAVRPGAAADEGPFRVSAIDAPGQPGHFLAVHRDAGVGADLVQRARQRWNLSGRQTEVLGELMKGHSTRTIGAHLGCATRTVEAHITAILEKCGAQSRTAVVARVWALG